MLLDSESLFESENDILECSYITNERINYNFGKHGLLNMNFLKDGNSLKDKIKLPTSEILSETLIPEFNEDQSKLHNKEMIKFIEKISREDECEVEEKNKDDTIQLSFMSSLSDNTYGLKCDPVAEYFKLHFRRARSSLARLLYYVFNEIIFDNQLPKLPLKWSGKLVTSSGITVIENDEQGTYIVLSKKIITTPQRLRDTLVHEMCHAAVWIINESRDCHGPIWKLWTVKARIRIPELPEISRCHTYDIVQKYLYRCENCGYCIGRSRPSDKLAKRCVCGYCGGRFKLKTKSD